MKTYGELLQTVVVNAFEDRGSYPFSRYGLCIFPLSRNAFLDDVELASIRAACDMIDFYADDV